MTFLIDWIPLFNLGIALVFARHIVTRWSQGTKKHYSIIDVTDPVERGFMSLLAIVIGYFWPLYLTFMALRWWLWKPVDQKINRINQLERELDDWGFKERNSANADDRQTARTIADTLRDILDREK